MKDWLVIVLLFGYSYLSSQQTVGLFINDEASLNGYTLFTNNNTTYLIDNCGYEVHSWESDFRPGLSVYILADGSLLRCNRTSGNFPGGGAGGHFERLSWDGTTIWESDFSDSNMQSHHDIEPLPNGNFLALAWTPMTALEAVAAGRLYEVDIWIEKIFEIKMIDSSDYEIVWEWSMADHLVQDMFPDRPNFGVVADNPGKMDFNYLPAEEGLDTDWAHFNAIAYNKDLDQIAVSSRDFSEIWILDHSTTTEEARTGTGGNSGKGGDILYRYGNPQVYDRGTPEDQVFFNQHNIEWIPEGLPNAGSLSVFNNRWLFNASRAERWTPPVNGYGYDISDGQAFGPQEVDWAYSEDGFYSSRISGVQFLSNGNALICSGSEGRFFEVTEEGEKVWEYINPIRNSSQPIIQGQVAVQNSVFRALRYTPDYSAFSGRDLSPKQPLELDPFDSNCIITNTENVPSNTTELILVNGNLIQDRLELSLEEKANVRLTNVQGESSFFDLDKGTNSIDMSLFPSGMYFLTLNQATVKLVKM